MSARLDEILGVLGSIAAISTARVTLPEVRRRRLYALKEVAKRLGITDETVRDACTRQLEPHVEGVDKFDRLVLDWLAGRSREIEAAIRHHAVDETDRSRIDQFFAKHGPR